MNQLVERTVARRDSPDPTSGFAWNSTFGGSSPCGPRMEPNRIKPTGSSAGESRLVAATGTRGMLVGSAGKGVGFEVEVVGAGGWIGSRRRPGSVPHRISNATARAAMISHCRAMSGRVKAEATELELRDALRDR